LRAIVFSPEKIEKIDAVPISQFPLLLDQKNVWFDGTPTEEEAKTILEKFGLRLTLLERCKKEKKVRHDVDEKCSVFIMQEMDYDQEVKTTPILILLGSNFLVSIHEQSSACNEAFDSFATTLKIFNLYTPSLVFFSISNNLSEQSLKVIDTIESYVWNIENEIMATSGLEIIRKITAIRKDLLKINKVNFSFARTLLSIKKGASPYVQDSKVLFLIDDIYDSIIQQIEIVDDYREILADNLEIFNAKAEVQLSAVNNRLTIVSNRLGQDTRDLTIVVLFLTVVSTIYMFPNTIATILGVASIGERLAWWLVLIIVGISMFIPIIWLARQKWIREMEEKGFKIPIVPFLPFIGYGRKKKQKAPPAKLEKAEEEAELTEEKLEKEVKNTI
jgi:magnesium transporter